MGRGVYQIVSSILWPKHSSPATNWDKYSRLVPCVVQTEAIIAFKTTQVPQGIKAKGKASSTKGETPNSFSVYFTY